MGLDRFTLPLIKRTYPSLIASKLVGVQPMTQPASLIFYLRYKYAKGKGLVPAPEDIRGAIILWMTETFPTLKIHHDEKLDPVQQYRIEGYRRVAIFDIWDGHVQFYQSKFEMADPEFFPQLEKAVVEYFTQ